MYKTSQKTADFIFRLSNNEVEPNQFSSLSFLCQQHPQCDHLQALLSEEEKVH